MSQIFRNIMNCVPSLGETVILLIVYHPACAVSVAFLCVCGCQYTAFSFTHHNIRYYGLNGRLVYFIPCCMYKSQVYIKI